LILKPARHWFSWVAINPLWQDMKYVVGALSEFEGAIKILFERDESAEGGRAGAIRFAHRA